MWPVATLKKNANILTKIIYHLVEYNRCKCKFLLKMERTSLVNLRASNIGSKSNKAVSRKSENQEVMGIALSASKYKQNKAVIVTFDWQTLAALLKCLFNYWPLY